MGVFLTPFIKKILKNLLIAVTDRNVVLAKDNTSAVDDTYFILLDNVGTVYTHEARSGQKFFHGFHAHE